MTGLLIQKVKSEGGGILYIPPPPKFEGRGVLYKYFIFGLTNPISFSD